MSLYIGAIYGGPELENSLFDRFKKKIAGSVKKFDLGKDEAALDIVFQVPGTAFSPEFEGLRSGSLSRRQKILQIQIAVPREVLQNDHRLKNFLLKSLRQAIVMGADVLKKASLDFSKDDNLAVIDQVEESL